MYHNFAALSACERGSLLITLGSFVLAILNVISCHRLTNCAVIKFALLLFYMSKYLYFHIGLHVCVIRFLDMQYTCVKMT